MEYSKETVELGICVYVVEEDLSGGVGWQRERERWKRTEQEH